MTKSLENISMPVLIVDDDPINLTIIDKILENESVTPIMAKSGEEALEKLDSEVDFGLILMDVQMPGMDGIETEKKIKENPNIKDIPIIFITAHGDEEIMKIKEKKIGAVDYIGKPVHADLLIYKVKDYIDSYRFRIELLNKLDF
jgi:CheY-like chemotaxis protein